MQEGTQEHEVPVEMERDAELATLYGGLEGVGEPYPMLVEPWEDAGWDEESELDAQILAGLLFLAP
jgi:hypothetical protein